MFFLYEESFYSYVLGFLLKHLALKIPKNISSKKKKFTCIILTFSVLQHFFGSLFLFFTMYFYFYFFWWSIFYYFYHLFCCMKNLAQKKQKVFVIHRSLRCWKPIATLNYRHPTSVLPKSSLLLVHISSCSLSYGSQCLGSDHTGKDITVS